MEAQIDPLEVQVNDLYEEGYREMEVSFEAAKFTIELKRGYGAFYSVIKGFDLRTYRFSIRSADDDITVGYKDPDVLRELESTELFAVSATKKYVLYKGRAYSNKSYTKEIRLENCVNRTLKQVLGDILTRFWLDRMNGVPKKYRKPIV